jgi:hypothetical protein
VNRRVPNGRIEYTIFTLHRRLEIDPPPPLPVPGVIYDRQGGFLRGLRDQGYVVGENLVIEYRFSEGRNERLPDLHPRRAWSDERRVAYGTRQRARARWPALGGDAFASAFRWRLALSVAIRSVVGARASTSMRWMSCPAIFCSIAFSSRFRYSSS